MDLDHDRDSELVTRLRRLDTAAALPAPGFDYEGMLERHAARVVRRRRRQLAVRGAAAGVVVALALASLWRIGQVGEPPPLVQSEASTAPVPGQPRIVRADTYLALAALEDHIASVDDALTYARLGGGGADVARLERARAELVDSYTRVRYADQVSANF